jgi:murein L,D-transpeptidase YcbB/YkuD
MSAISSFKQAVSVNHDTGQAILINTNFRRITMLLSLEMKKQGNTGVILAAAQLMLALIRTNQQLKHHTKQLIALILLALPLPAAVAEDNAASIPPISEAITTIIGSNHHPYLTQTNFTNRKDDLEALYKLNNKQLLWLNNADASKTEQLLKILADASSEGLNPETYNSKNLADQHPAALALTADAYKELALYDTALSLSVLRYLHDLHYGRVIPQGINFNLKLREKKLIDLPALIYTALKDNNIAQLPAQVEPKLQQYQKLKAALANFKLLAGKSTPLKLNTSQPIRPGEHLPQLTELQKFLQASGDLPEQTTTPIEEKTTLYSGKIVDGVKRFQQRHGLGADGVIGKGTVAALNEPVQQRVQQIELAMERLRWLPTLSPGRSIIVNIPAFQLWAFDDIEVFNPELTTMRVVVGKALKNQTPVLMAEMSFIDFMPYWNVPYNIVKQEILPKLAQNPGYLARENMEIVSKSGILGVNADSISLLKQGTARIRQRPGGKNALGKVKFIFPNKDDVYLHDTPSSSFFSRSRRDFSHGCVRVAKPEALANFALKDQMTPEEIKKALATPKNQRVVLKKPIPVLFFYSTAFFDHENKLVFYPDIYGHDTILMEALKKTEDLPDQAFFVSPPVPQEKPATPESQPELPAAKPPGEAMKPLAAM